MLVIDASAMVEALTSDPADIPDLISRLRGAEWMSAPFLIDYEVHNVLRKMTFRGDISEELAEESRHAFRNLRISRHAMTEDMANRVWELRKNASAYDASYVALAETLGVPLITTERRLAEGLKGLASIDIESYA
ncbi:type II toxin-antitoxin system VapC family toxin [Nonomuraea dietziae]|uniref:Putative nucleic acid-binding protein n=1 Tax=Nonomuraea dietziae TaxID=65515 RepID=A0A7W5V3B5_9ACTN|nr:type II toxin-antitoxin system VapC family toxin [Nonomuraea dietziae]MBB3728189.1 putative nucleic acid-binding protein [Nonomuraea dietziae]